jgi:hypothetical protein
MCDKCICSSFKLPELSIRRRVIAADHVQAKSSGMLFAMEAQTLHERRAAKRGTISERVKACADLVTAEPSEQWLAWVNLNDEGDELERAISGSVQVSGSDTREYKEASIAGFLDGTIRVIICKSSMFGHGLNLQNCARMAFVGLSDSFEQFYQAVRRAWRYGQTREVHCYVITSELEGAIVANIQRKEADMQRMIAGMLDHMRAEMTANIKATRRQTVDYSPTVTMKLPPWIQSEMTP